MGNGALSKIGEEASKDTNTGGTKLWRRDEEDLLLVQSILKEEEEFLRTQQLSPNEVEMYLRLYKKGVMKMRDGLIDIVRKDLIPANERAGFDPDYWFEINLTNLVLFPMLDLSKIGELLPGRLFTSRMPRNLASSQDSATKFIEKRLKYELDTIFILSAKDEYKEYAGADLDAFYKSLGIKVIYRPITDFGIPDQQDIIKDIKDITWLLANGKNVLVHGTHGNGRAGMVVAAVLKSVGVKNPIEHIRRVKSNYVDTKEQEDFVASLPAVIDSRISMKYPELAAVMALGTLQQAQQQYQATVSLRSIGHGEIKSPTTIEELGLTADQIVEYSAIFDLYNIDESDFISMEQLQGVLKDLGCSIPVTELFKGMDRDNDGMVSKFEFLLAMAEGGKQQ